LDSAVKKAKVLLDVLRRTAMRRGAITRRQRRVQSDIASTIEAEGIPPDLAKRIAFQLVFKFDVSKLMDRTVWRAIGQLLEQEMARLREHVGLVDRQIVTVLPKLSAAEIEEFFEELQATDRRIARTILNASLQAADPLAAGRRYLAEYRGVVEQLEAIDPSVARTLANASFTAGTPRKKALEHFERFANLMKTFRNEGGLARTPAKVAFRARDPVKAAEGFISDYSAALVALLANGVETNLAKTLASSSRFRAHLQRTGTRETVPEPAGQSTLTSVEREVLGRLRKENDQLRMEVTR
jgi:hypothetical protein